MREEEKIKNPVEQMEYLAKTFLPLDRWEYKESYRSEEDECIIFDSPWCRVKFVWGGWEMYSGYTFSVYYGRLYAPDDKVRMVWNGEECACWHSLMFDYLDGLTPEESAKGGKSLDQIWAQTGVMELQKQWNHERQKDERLTLALEMKMEAAIWDYYGLRLFELFDLRRPELWEQYRTWLKARYIAEGRKEAEDKKWSLIPYYRVC